MPFTPEELAEMAAADAEIEASFRLEQADLDRSRDLDRQAHFDGLDPEKQRVAAQRKAYREANTRTRSPPSRRPGTRPTRTNTTLICEST